MKHAKFAAILVLLSISACTSVEGSLSNSSPLAQHIQARGGATAIRAIKAIELQLDLVEPKFVLQAKYFSNRSNCMRIDIFNEGSYLQSEGVSSEGGWAVTAGDKSFSPQPTGGTETLLHGIESPVRMVGLDEFPGRGHKIAYDGPELIQSRPYDKFSAIYADGYTAELYVT